MNTTNRFSLHRLGLLIYKNFYERRRIYLMTFIVLYGVITLLYMFTLFTMTPAVNCSATDLQHVAFTNTSAALIIAAMFAMGFAAVSASQIMPDLGNKANRLQLLTLPALPSEKFVCSWLITTVGGLLMFLFAFMAADLTRVFAGRLFTDHQLLPILTQLFKQAPYHSDIWLTEIREESIYYLSFLAAVQSFFLLGGLVWHRLSFIKTFTAGMVLTLIFGTVIFCTLSLCYDYSCTYPRLQWLNNGNLIFWLPIGGLLVMTLCCWTIAFFRFRETELNHRL